MKHNIVVIALTLAVFMSGFVVGVMSQRHKPGRFPMPVPAMGEFAGMHDGMEPPPPRECDMPKSEEEMKAVRADMDAFKVKMDSIHEDFRAKVNGVLKEEQKAKWGALIDKRREGGPPPVHMAPHRRGDMNFIGMVIYKPVLERLTADLKLDSAQRTQVEELLKERREKTIALIDVTPPPSLGGDRFRR